MLSVFLNRNCYDLISLIFYLCEASHFSLINSPMCDWNVSTVTPGHQQNKTQMIMYNKVTRKIFCPYNTFFHYDHRVITSPLEGCSLWERYVLPLISLRITRRSGGQMGTGDPGGGNAPRPLTSRQARGLTLTSAAQRKSWSRERRAATSCLSYFKSGRTCVLLRLRGRVDGRRITCDWNFAPNVLQLMLKFIMTWI